MACRWLPFCCVLTWPFLRACRESKGEVIGASSSHKVTSPFGLESHPRTLLTRTHLPKGPLSKYSHWGNGINIGF